MADNEEKEETTPRGNEWEVVSLTASAYAAAPGPEQVEVNDDMDNAAQDVEVETSHAMFMSGHFIFPPSQHENLPLEPENLEIHKEQGLQDAASEMVVEEGGRSNTKGKENWNNKSLAVSDEFLGIELFGEKTSRLSISGTEFEEGTILQGLDSINKEQSLYDTAPLHSFHSEETMAGSTKIEDYSRISEPIEPSEHDLDSDLPDFPKMKDEDDKNYDGSELPCEAWWKKQAASFHAHAKEANTFWSIFIAAAVMGLVILGQRWQQEKWQSLQHKWKIAVNGERMGRMLGPISRFKEVIVGGHRRISFSRGSTSTNH